VADFCKHGNELSGYIKKADHYLTSTITINFSKNILYHGVSKSRSKCLLQDHVLTFTVCFLSLRWNTNFHTHTKQ